MAKTTKRKARATSNISPRRRRSDSKAKASAPAPPPVPESEPVSEPAGDVTPPPAVNPTEGSTQGSGQAYLPGVYEGRWLVLDLRDPDVQTLARSYARAIRVSKPTLAEAIAPHAGVNLGR